MAVVKPPSHFRQAPHAGASPFDDFKFNYKEFPIGGKLVTGTISISEHKMLSYVSEPEFKEFLKKQMTHQMCEYIISNGFVEFTQMKDHTTFDTIVKARCYLAPNDQVKILRTHYAGT
jgi:hypothetical protein